MVKLKSRIEKLSEFWKRPLVFQGKIGPLNWMMLCGRTEQLIAPIGLKPFQLVYGKSCHLPVELEHKAYWALKFFNFDHTASGERRKLQIHQLDEFRLHAYESS